MIRTFFILLVTAAGPLIGQSTTQGVVVDPSSRPIPNAAIDCDGHRATTDTQGRFTLDTANPCDSIHNRRRL